MTELDDGDASGTERVQSLETLQLHVRESMREADEATRIYDRSAWIRYAAVFIPIPFVVLLLRLHMAAWGYYVAGALFLALALLLYTLDLAAVTKRDKAIEAAERAREIYESARGRSDIVDTEPPREMRQQGRRNGTLAG